jgi:Asp-tRNA(Asn)/Glu-tRNA(Gln) amidotransferase A subunit family amidase
MGRLPPRRHPVRAEDAAAHPLAVSRGRREDQLDHHPGPDRYHLDAIAAPTNPPAWKTDCAVGDNDIIPSSTPAAVSGYPAVTVAAGFVGPLPVGISFMAFRLADGRVLAFAGAFAQATHARKPPKLLPAFGG